MKAVALSLSLVAAFVIACGGAQTSAPRPAAEERAAAAPYRWRAPLPGEESITTACIGPCPRLPAVEKAIADDPHWRRCLAFSDDYAIRPADLGLLERGRCGDLVYISTSVTFAGVVDWFDRDGVLVGEYMRSDVGHGYRGSVPICEQSEPEDTLCYVETSAGDATADPTYPAWHTRN